MSDNEGNVSPKQTVKLDLASISIKSSILPFWREFPRLWFAQFEIITGPSKLSDEQKFRYVISVLQTQDLQQISDIILDPPTNKKYDTIKERLLAVYEESKTTQFQKLLNGLELGDQKPTRLLRKMKELAGQLINEEGIKILWMNQLPTHVRTVLAVNSESSLSMLAEMADKMLEQLPVTSISAVERDRVDSTTTALAKQIENMSLEIAELQKRNSYHRRTYANRYSPAGSKVKRKPGDADWECRYHYKFGNKAKRCEPPCKHSRTQPKSGN